MTGEIEPEQRTYFAFKSDGLRIALEGECPGSKILRITGATPGGSIALVAGFTPGPFVVPGGPCPGLTLDIQPPFAPGAPILVRADPDGEFEATVPLRESWCGVLLQAVDLNTCAVSERVEVR